MDTKEAYFWFHWNIKVTSIFQVKIYTQFHAICLECLETELDMIKPNLPINGKQPGTNIAL